MGTDISISELVHDKDMPDGAKDLALQLLKSIKSLERNVVGSIELAYRRGEQSGKEHQDG